MTDFIVAVYSTRLGRVVNISENGIAIQLINTDCKSLPDECKTSILSKAEGFLIKEISLKLVRKEVMLSSPIDRVRLQTIGAKFNTSNAFQLDNIKQYILGLS